MSLLLSVVVSVLISIDPFWCLHSNDGTGVYGLLWCPFIFILKFCEVFDFAHDRLVFWKDDENVVQFDNVFDEKLVEVRFQNVDVSYSGRGQFFKGWLGDSCQEIMIRVDRDNFSYDDWVFFAGESSAAKITEF